MYGVFFLYRKKWSSLPAIRKILPCGQLDMRENPKTVLICSHRD